MNPWETTTTTTFADNTPEQSQVETKDGWGNFLSLVRGDGAVLSATNYDNLFRPIATSKLGNGTTNYEYEASPLSRVVKTTDAVDNEFKTQYLAANPSYPNLFPFTGTQTEDPNGHISKNWNDAFGKPVLRISGEGGVTQSIYDNFARIDKIINPINEIYDYTYNSMGKVATKEIPNKGPENFWYDKSMKLVAKDDANGNVQIFDYDNAYRLTKIGYASSASGFGDPKTAVLDEEFVNGSIEDDLLINTYAPLKTWIESTEKGILKGGGIDGDKTSTFTRDSYGRITSTDIVYSNGNSVVENIQQLNDAGIPLLVDKIITGPDGASQTLSYNYGIDDVLRQTTTTLTYEGQSTLVEDLVYNDFDQVQQKKIGGVAGGGFLQIVDYGYDGAGKILTINAPFETGCLLNKDVCQLYWGNVESNVLLEDENCGDVRGIILDGILYPSYSPIPISDVSAIEVFVDDQIGQHGKVGSTEVFYQNYAGVNEDFHISIMQTDVQTATLVFENCQYSLSTKECCEIIVVGQDGEIPVIGGPQNPDLFYEELTYDGLDVEKIEMIGSCSAGLIINRYKYDADHRVKEVHNTLFTPEKIDDAFSTSYTYDLAGNILSLKRNGWVKEYGDFKMIDDLEYIYEPNTSELKKVTDLLINVDPIAQPKGFGPTNAISDYNYDSNGNLKFDSGKNLNEITYNLLNLPDQVTHQNDGQLLFDYSFGGARIKKTSPDHVREYVGGAEYQDNTLELIAIPNGRIVNVEGSKRYQYHLSDHLGNTVVVFEDKNEDGIISLEEETEEEDREIIQRNYYYSFGLRVDAPHFLNEESPINQYLYNGKENNEELGLNWLAYGFRMYDPAIARFPSIDPISDQFSWVSPFNYAENKPVDGIDLWGLQYYNLTSRVGISGTHGTSGTLGNAGYDPYIDISMHNYPPTRSILMDIKMEVSGSRHYTLSESELKGYSYENKEGNQWDNTKGKGQNRNMPHRMPAGNVLVLAVELANKVHKKQIRNDFEETKRHLINLEKSVKMVENARDMQLIPDDISDFDMINFIQNSKMPEGGTNTERENFRKLGEWIFENREDILNDRIPNEDGNSIYESGYPLDKFEVHEQN